MGTITIMDLIMTITIEEGRMKEIDPEKDLEKNLETELLEKNLETELPADRGEKIIEKIRTGLPQTLEGKTGMRRDIVTLAMVGTAEVSARRP